MSLSSSQARCKSSQELQLQPAKLTTFNLMKFNLDELERSFRKNESEMERLMEELTESIVQEMLEEYGAELARSIREDESKTENLVKATELVVQEMLKGWQE